MNGFKICKEDEVPMNRVDAGPCRFERGEMPFQKSATVSSREEQLGQRIAKLENELKTVRENTADALAFLAKHHHDTGPHYLISKFHDQIRRIRGGK